MANRKDTLFEQFLAPVFNLLMDREALLHLRNSIDWPTATHVLTNPQVTYPDYYLNAPFHGIDKGYLTPDAAITYDPITRYVLPPNEVWVREAAVQSVKGYPRRILDLGCGTGSTTVLMQQGFPQAAVIGLDLSPYMLVMADRKAQAANLPIQFRHGDAAATGLPEGSFDLVTASLLFHETPPSVAKAILQEAFRLLRPGGEVVILDGNQRTLRSTEWLSNIFEEPFIQAYAQGSTDAWLGAVGFEAIRTEDFWWLHQITHALKPNPVQAPSQTPYQASDRPWDPMAVPGAAPA
ncbi:methyltransferase type 11 [filamentous cyanobacterium CCP5]|nr:methyltransferase type 11 [filamentous cyanobacterium CCT1]PSN19668.1 methyltransferase type 11 [filamentous cyanobacterium CCP5]